MKNKTLESKTDTQPSRSPYQAERAEAQQTPGLRPDPLAATPAPPGSEATVRAHAASLNRATAGRTLRRLQRQYGNRYVQRVVAQCQDGAEGFQLDDETTGRINRARGGGQPLDGAVQAHMSEVLGHDFSGVRVHTDAEADQLNQQLQARAFTTGADIFFKRGAYDPVSSSGRELIAHELTHVVQQGTGRVSGSGSGMTVRPAGDAFEKEADAASNDTQLVSQRLDADDAGEGARPDLASPADILALQRSYGNRAVQRLLAQRRRGDQGFALDDGAANRIKPTRGGGQPGRAFPTAEATIQRATLKQQGSDKPLEKGSIVVCHNPSRKGHRMVMEGGEQYGTGGLLTHAAIVGEGGATRIEAMGLTVEENAVKSGTHALYTEVHDGIGIPAAKGKIHEAARASVGKDRKYGVWWAYDRAGAAAAVEKGRLEQVLVDKRLIALESKKYKLTKSEIKALKEDIKVLEAKIEALKTAHPYPALVQDVEDKQQWAHLQSEAVAHEYEAALAGIRGDIIMETFHRHQAERLRAMLIKRPTARTWCVQFVVQAVQAAIVNEGQSEGKAEAFAAKVGQAPHVRDLYDAEGFAGHWRECEIDD